MLQRSGAWRSSGASSVSRAAADKAIKPHPETDNDAIDLGGSVDSADPDDVLHHIEEPAEASEPKTDPLQHPMSRSPQPPKTTPVASPTRDEIARQVAHERDSQQNASAVQADKSQSWPGRVVALTVGVVALVFNVI